MKGDGPGGNTAYYADYPGEFHLPSISSVSNWSSLESNAWMMSHVFDHFDFFVPTSQEALSFLGTRGWFLLKVCHFLTPSSSLCTDRVFTIGNGKVSS